MPNYLQSIQPWAKAVLEEREKNPLSNMYRTPFVVMSSGAFVAKGNVADLTSKDVAKRKSAIDTLIDKGSSDTYCGCIISNNINNLELSYSNGETPVGVDFNGKIIKVVGETGRKVSTPIITSVDVDTEESSNTIKNTRVSVTCFTLKQLELFEMFFLKPGMNVMVEWGDSSLLKRGIFQQNRELKYIDSAEGKTITPYTDISSALFIKQNSKWDDYCDKFSDMYTPSTKNLKDILQNIRKSLGSYEYTAGKVSEYSYTISEGGIYTVNIDIIQSNQMSLSVPVNATPKNAGIKKQKAKSGNTTDQIVQTICSDFNIDPANDKKLKSYEKEWFNFLKKNDQQKDTLSNSEAYVSLRFVAKYIMNITSVDDETANASSGPQSTKDEYYFELPKYDIDGKDTELIPVHSSPYMISSNTDVLYPNKSLVDFKQNKSANNNDNIVSPVTGSKIDGSINGYTFHLTEKVKKLPPQGNIIEITKDDNKKIGNALNIFIKYSKVVDIFNKSTTRIEFMKDVLDLINKNSYGLFKLIIAPEYQDKKATIIDYKFAPQNIQDSLGNIPPYRFKPTTINSIVKNFNFNFQMDNLIAGKMFFNSAASIREAVAKQKKQGKTTQQIPASVESFKAYDYSAFGNADGYYSFNNIERKRQEKLWNRLTDDKPQNDKTVEDNVSTTKDPKPDVNEIIKNKELKFKLSQSKDPVRLVYRDPQLIQSTIGLDTTVKSIVSNIDVSVTIDGFSGFRAGECFHIDGIPEIFNQVGIFQIMNIKHAVNTDEGWTTTLEASLRVGTSK